RLAAADRDQLEAHATDRQVGAALDRDVGGARLDVLDVEAGPEEVRQEGPRGRHALRDLVRAVAPGGELRRRAEGAEKSVAPEMVAVRVRDEDRRQVREARRV